jgi:hypothetical protein
VEVRGSSPLSSTHSKEFYKVLRWREDADIVASDDLRIVELTPPGSGPSISFGTGVTTMTPGSQQGLLLVTDDSRPLELSSSSAAPRSAKFSRRGRTVPPEPSVRLPGRDPDGQSYQSHAVFSDPDGNGWVLQEVTQRLPGR